MEWMLVALLVLIAYAFVGSLAYVIFVDLQEMEEDVAKVRASVWPFAVAFAILCSVYGILARLWKSVEDFIIER